MNGRKRMPVHFEDVEVPVYECGRCGREAAADVTGVVLHGPPLGFQATHFTAPDGWDLVRWEGNTFDVCGACKRPVRTALAKEIRGVM